MAFDFVKTLFKNAAKGFSYESPTSSTKAAVSIDGHEAAAWSRDRSRIYGSNPDSDSNPHPSTRGELLRLSRYAAKNFPLTAKILSTTEANAIGAGLVANAATEDKIFNKAASAAFEQWASNAFCSVSNNYNFYEMQKLMSRELILAGEVFILLQKTDTSYPQISLVKSENVRHSGKKEDTSTDGLWLDEFGRVIAYNIYRGVVCVKVDASNVVHIIRHTDIDQLRGIGSFRSSLNALRDFHDLMQLETKATKIHSRIAVVVEKAGGEANQGVMGGEDMRLDAADGITDGRSNRRLETPFGEGTVLDKGEKLNLVSSDRSTTGFQAHLELLGREVCQSVNLPYEFVVNSEKLNGTSMRFAIADAANYFRDIQDRLLDGGLLRVYGYVISCLIKRKELAAPKVGLPFAVSFTRPQSVTVDAGRVSTAEIGQLQNSLLTYESYYSARGKDWRQELAQKAEEEAYLDELSAKTGVNINRLRSLAAGTTPIEDKTETPEEDAKAA